MKEKTEIITSEESTTGEQNLLQKLNQINT